MKFTEGIVLLVLGAVLALVAQHFFFQNKGGSNTTIESTIVLEKIQMVSKLVTAEGEYSNVYHVEDYKWFNMGPFRKQATIRVKLRALVGINLEKIKITPDEATKTFYIDSIPEVEPIAIDPEVEYYDMSEGLFNGFDKNDLNKINKVVRQMTTDAIRLGDKRPKNMLDSLLRERYTQEMNGFFEPLLEKARAQGVQQLSLIDFVATTAGWKVVYVQPQYQKQPIPEGPAPVKQ